MTVRDQGSGIREKRIVKCRSFDSGRFATAAQDDKLFQAETSAQDDPHVNQLLVLQDAGEPLGGVVVVDLAEN